MKNVCNRILSLNLALSLPVSAEMTEMPSVSEREQGAREAALPSGGEYSADDVYIAAPAVYFSNRCEFGCINAALYGGINTSNQYARPSLRWEA